MEIELRLCGFSLDPKYVPYGFYQSSVGNVKWYFEEQLLFYYEDATNVVWNVVNKELRKKIESIIVSAYEKQAKDYEDEVRKRESDILASINEIHGE